MAVPVMTASGKINKRLSSPTNENNTRNHIAPDHCCDLSGVFPDVRELTLAETRSADVVGCP